MQRIPILLKKIADLAQQEKTTVIDLDLMLDYTRVLYADLLELKKDIAAKPVQEPTLAEVAKAIEQEQPVTPASATPYATATPISIPTPSPVPNPSPSLVSTPSAPVPAPASVPVHVVSPELVDVPAPVAVAPVTPVVMPEEPAVPEYVSTAASKMKDADVRQKIGINDKYLIISELFSNNKDVYEEVLSELNDFDTYQQAVQWIEAHLFNQYNWDEENDTVQLFYTILRNFFSAR